MDGDRAGQCRRIKGRAAQGIRSARVGQAAPGAIDRPDHQHSSVGDEEARSKDVLGRVYEYFLSQFASNEGKKGGEFYTPRCIVKAAR